MTPRRTLSALTLALLLAVPAAARADVITPDEEACTGKAAGDACILPAGGAGVCVTRTVPVGNPMSGATRMRTTCEAGAAATDGGSSGTDAGSGGSDAGPAVTPRSGCAVGPATPTSRGASTSLALLAGSLVAGLALRTARRRG